MTDDGNNRGNASDALREHSALDPDLINPEEVNIEEIEGRDIQVNEGSAGTASVGDEMAEGGADILEGPGGPSGPSQHVNGGSSAGQSEEYNEEVMDRVAEALHGVRETDGRQRYSLFKDIADLEEEKGLLETDEIVDELAESYEEDVTDPEHWIERMVGDEEEGVFEETHLYDREEGVTELGADMQEALEDLESYFQQIYAERAERSKFSDDKYNISMPEDGLIGPMDSAIRFGEGRDQNMGEWAEEAVAKSLRGISRDPQRENINRFFELLLSVENPETSYDSMIADKVGRGSTNAMRVALSTRRDEGYLKPTDETMDGQDREVSRLGDKVLDLFTGVYESELERYEGEDKEKIDRLVENAAHADPTSLYREKANRVDGDIRGMREKGYDVKKEGVEKMIEEVPEAVKIYSEELEY